LKFINTTIIKLSKMYRLPSDSQGRYSPNVNRLSKISFLKHSNYLEHEGSMGQHNDFFTTQEGLQFLRET